MCVCACLWKRFLSKEAANWSDQWLIQKLTNSSWPWQKIRILGLLGRSGVFNKEIWIRFMFINGMQLALDHADFLTGGPFQGCQNSIHHPELATTDKAPGLQQNWLAWRQPLAQWKFWVLWGCHWHLDWGTLWATQSARETALIQLAPSRMLNSDWPPPNSPNVPLSSLFSVTTG